MKGNKRVVNQSFASCGLFRVNHKKLNQISFHVTRLKSNTCQQDHLKYLIASQTFAQLNHKLPAVQYSNDIATSEIKNN